LGHDWSPDADNAIHTDEGAVAAGYERALVAGTTVYAYLTRPWIHTRSRVVHLGAASVGGVATVTSTVVDRFDTRAGERAVADIMVLVDDRPVAYIEHEALVRLA